MSSRIGVDIGGTFTDFIVYDENDKELLHYLFGNSGQDWQHNYIRKQVCLNYLKF